MDVFTKELEGHMEATKKKADGLVSQLEELGSLEQALVDSEQELKTAIASVSDMTQSTKALTQAVVHTLESFDKATETIKNANLDQMKKTVREIEKRCEATENQMSKDFKNIKIIGLLILGIVIISMFFR